MPPNDFVDDLLLQEPQQVSGGNMDGEEVVTEMVGQLVEIGQLTEIGAAQLKGAIMSAKSRLMPQAAGTNLPSPAFARSERATARRAPLGMIEDGNAVAGSWTLGAAIGDSTTVRGKVSRVAHVNRLLIVASAPGAVISSIKVGDEEQMLAGGVPVELYGPEALTDSVPDDFSPLAPGLDFIVTLVNTTANALTGTIGCKATCKR